MAEVQLVEPGNPYLSGRISKVDFLVLTSSDQVPFSIEIIYFSSLQKNYLNEEVNCTGSSP